jgi:hypothetical protein
MSDDLPTCNDGYAWYMNFSAEMTDRPAPLTHPRKEGDALHAIAVGTASSLARPPRTPLFSLSEQLRRHLAVEGCRPRCSVMMPAVGWGRRVRSDSPPAVPLISAIATNRALRTRKTLIVPTQPPKASSGSAPCTIATFAWGFKCKSCDGKGRIADDDPRPDRS